jgi:hypothetical protein
MFYRLLFIFLCLSQFKISAQNRLQFESYQFSWGAVMSSKIPAASYNTYSFFVNRLFDDSANVNLSTPYSLTTLRLTPNLMAQLYFKNTTNGNLHRIGISGQNRIVSSFAMLGNLIPDPNNPPWIDDTSNVVIKLEHSTPVLTLDYAWLKQVPVSPRFLLSIGAGTYLGMSMLNRVKGILLRYQTNGSSSGNSVFSYGGHFENFTKHTLNMGLYTSLGFSYCLNAPNAPRQKWYLTYESRFGIDYFAMKNVPSTWLSFQNNQVLGLRYMLAH